MGEFLLVGSLLLAAALAASLLAGRLRVPALLLFLGLGMLVGSDGVGWLEFDDYELAREIGTVALALILFDGGLTTNVRRLLPVAGPAASLAVVGTLVTALLIGVTASWIFDLSLLEGLLLGSIVASTDVAATLAMLRGSHLKPRLTQLLEGEAGSNDPVAILLVIGFIDWIQTPGYGVPDMLLLALEQFGIGILAGVAIGWLAGKAIARAELGSVGLYPVASLTVAGLAFGTADVLGGSGFLAVYLAGLAMSASRLPARRTIGAFHSGLAWVSQLVLFLVLGLLVFPSSLGDVAIQGTLVALILALVARPVATVVATAPFRLARREQAFLGWAGLRGAVPVVLATFPVIAHVPGSLEFFNIVFFAVLVSLIVQGPTIVPFAKRLELTSAQPALPEPLLEIGAVNRLGAEVVEFRVRDGDAVDGLLVRDLGLPREAVVNVIVRGEEAIAPRGSTRVRGGDRLHVLVRREVSDEVEDLMARWREGPLGPGERPRRTFRGPPIFTVRPDGPGLIEGDPGSPEAVLGSKVVLRLRARRDAPGALVALEDGRYAMTGPLVAVGSRRDLRAYAARRVGRARDEESSWLQAVIGTLTQDEFD